MTVRTGEDEVVITYLEMRAPPEGPPPPAPEGVSVVCAEAPTAAFYRFLYDTVGGPWQWTDRRGISEEAFHRLVRAPGVDVHVLYHHGTPAGFCELDHAHPPDVELVYFGLMPSFVGRGLGRFFLEWTVREAWRRRPERVWVHTCTRDHPRALPLYRSAGFVPYREEVQRP